MKNTVLFTKENTLLVIVDIQDKLARQMPDKETVLKNTGKLIKVIQKLQIPCIYTEQYPAGLGRTVPELEQYLLDVEPIDKLSFSCCQDDRFMNALSIENRSNILLTGMETHICVMQTGLELLTNEYAVGIVQDAVCSYSNNDDNIALSRLQDSGAVIVTTEMILYELLKKAGTDDFKALLPVLKDR